MKNFLLYFLWLLVAFATSVLPTQAQLTITDGVSSTPQVIANKLMTIGGGVYVNNAKIIIAGSDASQFTGIDATNAKKMYGTYASTDAFDEDSIGTNGVIIANGRVLDAKGSSTGFASTNMGFGGDGAIPQSFDAIALQFDAYPIGNELVFDYCFASEEYPEYVCSNFNDQFRFLVTGKNPVINPATGAKYPDYQDADVAVIPNTPQDLDNNIFGTAVSINSVNHGNPTNLACASSNSIWHNDLESAHMKYDQRTKGLKVRIPVVPCEKYTFYLLVADRADGIFDTGVFIQPLRSNPPSVNITTNSVLKDALEGCVHPMMNLSRVAGLVGLPAEIFKVELSGTATFAADYDVELNGTPVSSSTFNVSFGAGVASVSLRLVAKADGLAESTEKVIVKLYKLSCNIPGQSNNQNEFLLYEGFLNILDKETYQFIENNIKPVVYRCSDTDPVPKLKSGLADAYKWSSADGSFIYTLLPSLREIQPDALTHDATYKLEATIGDCANATVIEKSIRIDYSVLKVNTPTPICTGQSATLIATGRENYTWSPAAGLSCTNCATPSANPTATTVYTVTGTEGTGTTAPDGCSGSLQVTVEVKTEPGPQFVGLLSSYCRNDAVVVALAVTPVPTAGGTYYLTPAGGTPTVITSFAPSTLAPGTYEVRFLKNGATIPLTCVDEVKKTVLINDLPTITFDFATSVCKNGTAIPLSAMPSNGIFKINGTTVTSVDPALYPAGNVTVDYVVTDNNTSCLNTKSITVAIKPLPTFEWFDVQDAYCKLDESTITPKLRIIDADGTITIRTLASFVPANEWAIGNNPIVLTIGATGSNGCSDITTKTIRINEPVIPIFVGLLDEYCQQALPVTLQATPTGGFFKVNGVTATSFAPQAFAVGDVVTIDYFYNANGCEAKITKEVKIVQGTEYTPITEVLIVCPPTSQGYPLEALPLSLALPSYKYEWTSPITAINGQTTREVYLKEGQNGKHTVLVRDAGNCPIHEFTFDVTIKCNTAFFIPTAFSPNGDGKNDMLGIFGADFTKLKFRIYNRWGEVVFTAHKKEEGWDGKVGGAPAPAGIYTWKASYESVLQVGKVLQQEGSINLIR